MKQQIVPTSIFKHPESASRLQLWLDNSSTQKRLACLKLLSSLSGIGSYAGATVRAPIVTSRPSTATGCRGAPSLTAEGQKCSLKLRRPQTASSGPNISQERPRDATKGMDIGTSDALPMHTSAWMTTNDQFYGFRKLYPGVYNTAAKASRAVQAPNMLFSSEYADSLKRGAGPYWRRFLQTSNQIINNSVYPPTTDDPAKHDQCFFNWMQRQRLYYGDLLTDVAAMKMDRMMQHADKSGRLELLEALRLLYAALQSDRLLASQLGSNVPMAAPCRHKSTMHATHSQLKSMSDPYYEALQKDVTKAMAMGMPVEPTVAGSGAQCRHKVTYAPSSLNSQAKKLAQPARAKPAVIDKDMFASKIPMKWAVAGNHSTAYVDSIGRSAQKAADSASKRRKPFVPVVNTSPYGDTHSFIGNECTLRLKRLVVPEAFLHHNPPLFTNPDRNPPSTNNLMGFPKPSAADTVKNGQQAARQVEQAAAMKNLSTIPLGRGGIQLPHDDHTEKSRNYHVHPIDVAANNAATWRAKLANNGPTSTVGVTVGGWVL